MTSGRELMRLHLEALFTHDAEKNLVRVNEPRGAPAPRFFFGRTLDGAVWRCRHDVGRDLRRELQAAAEDDVRREHVLDSPLNPSRYEDILARVAPVKRTWVGPAFRFPHELRTAIETILITERNAELLCPFLEDWIPDVQQSQPLFAVTVDGHAVTVCGSVRRTSLAHEAGVATAPSYRGRGYAAEAVTAWARAVVDMGLVQHFVAERGVSSSRAQAWVDLIRQ